MVNTNKQPAIKKMSKVDRKDLNSLKYTIASEPVGTTWPFEDFVRMHGEYDALVMADSRNGVLEYGTFGILFFPLFMHYWLYKGIKACVSWVKKNCSSNNK
jgi:hypothetical protein